MPRRILTIMHWGTPGTKSPQSRSRWTKKSPEKPRVRGKSVSKTSKTKRLPAARMGPNQKSHSELVSSVFKNSLSKLTSIYKQTTSNAAFMSAVGPLLAYYAKQHMPAEKLMQLLQERFMPRAYGPLDSDAGVLRSFGAHSEAVTGSETKQVLYHREHLRCIRSKEFQTVIEESNRAEKIFVWRENSPTYETYFSDTGLNCKGYVSYGRQLYVESGTQMNNWTYDSFTRNSTTSAQNYYYYPLGWDNMDDTIALSQMADISVLPSPTSWLDQAINGADMNKDVYFPIISRHIELTLLNANSLIPGLVKIYLLKRKTDCIAGLQGDTPVSSLVGSLPTTTNPPTDAVVNKNYITRNTSSKNEVSVHLDVFPGLSATFKENYKIVKVDSFELEAGGRIQYEFQQDMPSLSSAREIAFRRDKGIGAATNEYCLLIEFQGTPGVAVNINKAAGEDPTKGVTWTAQARPMRLRVDCNKYVKVAWNAREGSMTDVTYVNQLRSSTPEINTSLPVRTYTQYRQGLLDNAVANDFYCPVETDVSINYGAPIGDALPAPSSEED